MKRILTLIMIFLLFSLFGCLNISSEYTMASTSDIVSDSPSSTAYDTTYVTTSATSNETTSQVIEYDYFGEDLPFNEAIRFDPIGYSSDAQWHWHGTPVFSPDGKEMFWSKYIHATDSIEIWYTVKSGETWGEASKFSIDGIDGSYNCPVFSRDGNELFFINLNSLVFTIFKVTRSGDSWVNPEAIDLKIPDGKILGWSFSVSNNGNIYFLLWDLNGLEPQKIYRSVYCNGEYGYPEVIKELNTNSFGVGGPLIAPDESYIIFDSNQSGGLGMHDIYISFINNLGDFSSPVNLGNQVNTSNEDTFASLSPDGLYMFYVSLKNTDQGFNPYWIKLAEIEVFKNR